MTVSAAVRPVSICAASEVRMPSVTGRLAAAAVRLDHQHKLAHAIGAGLYRFRRERATHSAAVRPVMVVCTGVPAFNVPFRFSTRSHTSTVVLPGSSAGLMSETFAGTGSATREQ